MAGEKDPAAQTAEETPVTGEPKQEAEGKTFTQAELEAEADRRAQKAAETARKNALEEAARQREAELKKAEAERLKEQGEYKTLHEKSQAELDALRAVVADKERRETITSALREAGLSDYETALLADRDTPEKFVAAAKSIAELVKKQVDAEVARRLETPPKAGPDSKKDTAPRVLYPSMQRTA